jgi:hypothetical protein
MSLGTHGSTDETLHCRGLSHLPPATLSLHPRWSRGVLSRWVVSRTLLEGSPFLEDNKGRRKAFQTVGDNSWALVLSVVPLPLGWGNGINYLFFFFFFFHIFSNGSKIRRAARNYRDGVSQNGYPIHLASSFTEHVVCVRHHAGPGGGNKTTTHSLLRKSLQSV